MYMVARIIIRDMNMSKFETVAAFEEGTSSKAIAEHVARYVDYYEIELKSFRVVNTGYVKEGANYFTHLETSPMRVRGVVIDFRFGSPKTNTVCEIYLEKERTRMVQGSNIPLDIADSVYFLDAYMTAINHVSKLSGNALIWRKL